MISLRLELAPIPPPLRILFFLLHRLPRRRATDVSPFGIRTIAVFRATTDSAYGKGDSFSPWSHPFLSPKRPGSSHLRPSREWLIPLTNLVCPQGQNRGGFPGKRRRPFDNFEWSLPFQQHFPSPQHYRFLGWILRRGTAPRRLASRWLFQQATLVPFFPIGKPTAPFLYLQLVFPELRSSF